MDNPTFATAIVTEVAANGLKLKFPGEETGGAKVYPCNAGCSFAVGDRVVVYPDSGTYIAMFPLGAPGSKIKKPTELVFNDGTTAISAINDYHTGKEIRISPQGGKIGFFGIFLGATQPKLANTASTSNLIKALKTIGIIGDP